MPDPARALPGWPRALRPELAAEYCGLSLSSFRTHIAPAVQPIHLTRTAIAYLREDLDAWLDARRLTDAPSPAANPWHQDR